MEAAEPRSEPVRPSDRASEVERLRERVLQEAEETFNRELRRLREGGAESGSYHTLYQWRCQWRRQWRCCARPAVLAGLSSDSSTLKTTFSGPRDWRAHLSRWLAIRAMDRLLHLDMEFLTKVKVNHYLWDWRAWGARNFRACLKLDRSRLCSLAIGWRWSFRWWRISQAVVDIGRARSGDSVWRMASVHTIGEAEDEAGVASQWREWDEDWAEGDVYVAWCDPGAS